jgi:hypothetical protein
MKALNIKLYLIASVLFCGLTTSAQAPKQTSKDLLYTGQVKRDRAVGKKLADFTPKFKPSVNTTANQPEGSGYIIDTKDIRVFPSANIQSEVHISINKKNPDNLIASTNTLLGIVDSQYLYNQGYYYSLDGGKIWNGSDSLKNVDSFEFIAGDPATAFAANGTAIMTTIDFSFNTFSYGYLFQKSPDGGITWSHAKQGANYLTFGFDKQMIAADNYARSPYANNFYNAWTDFSVVHGEVLFNRSTNLGATFSKPIILRTQVEGFGQGTNVQTGPNGEVYVCWADHDTVAFPFQADGLGFTSSMDGGATFTSSKKVFKYNGIRTFGDDSTFNFTRVADFPSMAVDKSDGPNRGRIYVTYPVKQTNTGKAIIQVRSSDNQGKSWYSPVTVSIPKGRQNWFPWIVVDDSNGDVWVTYYSFDKPIGYATNTYVALSTDGGLTWHNQKVSDVSHITAPINNNYFASGYAGDYIGIAAYGGKAFPIWMDDRNGTWQLYCSSVSKFSYSSQDLNITTAKDNKNGSVSPNPFNNTIQLKSSIEPIGAVELYNESGKLIKRWENVKSNNLNTADVPRGVYIIKIIDKQNKAYTQKLIKE